MASFWQCNTQRRITKTSSLSPQCESLVPHAGYQGSFWYAVYGHVEPTSLHPYTLGAFLREKLWSEKLWSENPLEISRRPTACNQGLIFLSFPFSFYHQKL